jgi:hypothetical protein
MLRSTFLLLATLAGCSTPPMLDSEMMIQPGQSTDILVEEEGNMVCVTENGDPASRTCVPRVSEE